MDSSARWTAVRPAALAERDTKSPRNTHHASRFWSLQSYGSPLSLENEPLSLTRHCRSVARWGALAGSYSAPLFHDAHASSGLRRDMDTDDGCDDGAVGTAHGAAGGDGAAGQAGTSAAGRTSLFVMGTS